MKRKDSWELSSDIEELSCGECSISSNDGPDKVLGFSST